MSRNRESVLFAAFVIALLFFSIAAVYMVNKAECIKRHFAPAPVYPLRLRHKTYNKLQLSNSWCNAPWRRN